MRLLRRAALMVACASVVAAGCSGARDSVIGEPETLESPQGATAPAAYITEATFVFAQARDAFWYDWPATEDSLALVMQEIGFKRELKYSWAYRADSTGTTEVSCIPKSRFSSVTYTPRKAVEVAADLVNALRSKATEVHFTPPDEMAFEFEDKTGLSTMTSQVVITLPLGTWKYTACQFTRRASNR